MTNNKFAWASISERGTPNGKVGDQTGKEVKIGNYYNFGQTTVIRFRSTNRGKKVAEIAKKLANCEKIGYGQDDRITLFNMCKRNKWDVEKTLKNAYDVNTDCSMLCACAINLAYGREIVPPSFYTGNAVALTVKKHPTKFRRVSVKNCENKPHKGDMPLKPGKHIIINV